MQKIMGPDSRAKKMAGSTGLMTTKIDGKSSCCLIHKKTPPCNKLTKI
jgi:hypothetical protein